MEQAKIAHPVYLCGPMNSCSADEMKGWRDWVKERLDGCIDPTETMGPNKIQNYEHGKISPAAIIKQDLGDINNSTFLIVNYDGSKPMVGSAMEMFYATNKPTPCFVFTIVEDIHKVSPWLIHHSNKIFETKDSDWETQATKILDTIVKIRETLNSLESERQDRVSEIQQIIRL